MANEQKKIISQLVKEGIYPDAATAGKAIKRYLQLAVKFMDAVDFAELWYEINTEK